jgi:hypothetical protein
MIERCKLAREILNSCSIITSYIKDNLDLFIGENINETLSNITDFSEGCFVSIFLENKSLDSEPSIMNIEPIFETSFIKNSFTNSEMFKKITMLDENNVC